MPTQSIRQRYYIRKSDLYRFTKLLSQECRYVCHHRNNRIFEVATKLRLEVLYQILQHKRRAVAARTARSRVNLYTHCLGTIDIPEQVVYLSRSQ